MERLETEGLDYLRTVEMQFDGAGDVECVVRFGDPVPEILQEAEAFGADLIAVTTEGRSAVGRTLLGSVAEQVVRKADAPVMLIRPGRYGL
jgi:nucleotide-binding universal stress UspA family protein